jgi:hypothetical protein
MQIKQVINGNKTFLSAAKKESNEKKEQIEPKTRFANKKSEEFNNLKSEHKIKNWIMSGRNVNNLCMPNPLNQEQNGKIL